MVRRALFKKLLRDIWNAKSQFLSLIVLSMLSILTFSGLDGTWRNIDVSVERYFQSQKLADFWISMPYADKDTVAKISNIEGVKDVQNRFSMECMTTLPGEPTLMLHAVNGDIRMNIPVISEGSLLCENDLFGCLLEQQFAQAHGLKPGSRLTLNFSGLKVPFIIRGLVTSPEYIVTAKDVLPDPDHFGFIYANLGAFPNMQANEICVVIKDPANESTVKASIEKAIPFAFVQTRNTQKSTSTIKNEIKQFQSYSSLFPLLFFSVAALIILTTMTRMVGNQRTQLGLLKALGLNKRKIFLHYLSYGFFPSAAGSIAGLTIGRNTLPGFIWNMLSEYYKLPQQLTAPVSAAAYIICLLCIFLSCFICYMACKKNIHETASSLLRPKPPKAGAQIFLEHFKGLWNRFGFSAKMVQKNLFRSKLRSIMALAGVICCTALIITTFGIQDTFNNMINTYYNKTLRYDVQVNLKSDADSLAIYKKRVPANTIEGAMQMPLSVKGSGKNKITLLTVLENNQTLTSFGDDSASEKLPSEGIIMTEKLAENMRLHKGDTITLNFPGDSDPCRITIERLAPVNFGQGLYMSEDTWKRLGKNAFMPTVLYIQGPSDNCNDYLRRLNEVDSIQWVSSLKAKAFESMQSGMSVSALMITFAFVMAFAVLYNMGILNFLERTREFATLKVLGFHQKEIRSLIGRENAIITIIGTILGIMPGLWLNTVMMRESELEDMVFAPFVSVESICAACAITILFSLFIQLLLAKNVKTLDMVEALKSIE